MLYFLLLVATANAEQESVLVGAVVVSRHGIRSPFAPDHASANDYTNFTKRQFPSAEDWGMDAESFSKQHVTPQGKINLQAIGTWFKQKFAAESNGAIGGCDDTIVFADHAGGAPRDVTSALNWFKGFGCPNIKINEVDESNNTAMLPVLNDGVRGEKCKQATQEQIQGWYGDVDSVIASYATQIQKVNDVMQVPSDAPICKIVDPSYNTSACTLLATGYQYSGLPYQGFFASPLFWAGNFAENFMLQYVSGLDDWAWGDLELSTLLAVYDVHIRSFAYAGNPWTAKAYGSQQLGYIVASLVQMMTQEQLHGVSQAASKRLVVLFSHDTNLLYLKRLLGVGWTATGFHTNAASTAGALTFELWKNISSNHYSVKLNYVTASPDQQRFAAKLNYTHIDPSVSPLVLPGCDHEECDFDRFIETALSGISIECVADPLQATLNQLKSTSSKPLSEQNVWVMVGIAIATFVVGCGGGFCISYLCRSKDKSNPNYGALQDEVI